MDYDVIIDINGMIDDWGYQLSNVRYRLKEAKNKSVLVRVNSYGGSVNSAMMISEAFKDHGNVTARFRGFNASAATWMVFGAKRVEMSSDGLWLCHRSSITVDIYKQMNTNDLDDAIKRLKTEKKNTEAVDLVIAKMYAEKSGKDVETVLSLMNEERWLNAEEVKELGFVDAIVKDGKTLTDDAKNFMIANCSELHLPCPVFPRTENLVDRLVNGFRSIFATAQTDDDGAMDFATETPTANTETNNPINTNIEMNKKFIFVNLLLAVEGFEITDGKVTLTEDQMQKIEDALASADVQKKDTDKAVASLDGISDTVKAIDGLSNKVLALKAILDRVPATAPATPVTTTTPEDKKQKSLDDVAKDPINQEARCL